MRQSVLVFLVALAASIIFCGSFARSYAADPAQPPASLFAGKIALVQLGGGEAGHAYLTDSRMDQLGGKAFIVGCSIDPVSGNPIKGTTSWLSVDHVLRITVFDSHDLLVEQMKQQQQRQPR